jgi:hypothetical protein
VIEDVILSIKSLRPQQKGSNRRGQYYRRNTMVFKFTFNHKFNFGSKGAMGDSNIVSAWSKVKTFFSGKKAAENDDPKTFLEGGAEMYLLSSGTASLDISVEEMASLLKYQVESDKSAWALMKEMGRDLIKGEKALRAAAKEAIPEWQEICHKADMKEKENFEEKMKGSSEKKHNPFSEL